MSFLEVIRNLSNGVVIIYFSNFGINARVTYMKSSEPSLDNNVDLSFKISKEDVNSLYRHFIIEELQIEYRETDECNTLSFSCLSSDVSCQINVLEDYCDKARVLREMDKFILDDSEKNEYH